MLANGAHYTAPQSTLPKQEKAPPEKQAASPSTISNTNTRPALNRLTIHRFALTTPGTTNCLLFLNASQFTLRNMPAFAPHRAQNPCISNPLAKAAQQLILGFIRFNAYCCQNYSPPFRVSILNYSNSTTLALI